MRLGIFHPAFEVVRGAELLVAAQIRYYHEQGLAPEAVTLALDASTWASRLEGIPVRLIQKRHWSDPLFGWSPLAKLRRRGLRAEKLLKAYDLIIAHNFPSSAMLGAARIQARKIWQCNEPPRGIHMRQANPVLTARVLATEGRGLEDACPRFAKDLETHDRIMGRDSSAKARHAYDLEAAKGLDLIYAISEFSRDNARHIYGRCEDRVIYPIVRFPEAGVAKQGLDRTVRRILVHSRLEVLKNIDTVIRGFSGFSRKSPVPCELHVVGEGPSRERLEALAQDLNLEKQVVFHGFLSDQELRRVYQLCDVFALLTLDEPFGMVYPEAAAKGLLLVGPNHGGPLEILDGGRLGWSIDAFSPEALGETFDQIWSLDDAEVDSRREAVDRACRSRFGLASIGPQLMDLVRTL